MNKYLLISLLAIHAFVLGCVITTSAPPADDAEDDSDADDAEDESDDAPSGDRDGDGLADADEARTNTSPDDRDSDQDGVNDGEEDHDGDGASNRDELAAGTDPADSEDNPAAIVDWTLTGPVVLNDDGPEVVGVLTVQLLDECTDGAVLDEMVWAAAAVTFADDVDEAPRYFFAVADGEYGLRASLDVDGDGVDDLASACRRYTLEGRGYIDLPLSLCTVCR